MTKKRGTAAAPRPPTPPLTHFLCIPLVTPFSRPQLEASVSRFTDEMASPETNLETQTAEVSNVSSVPPEAIRPVGSLHCTLGVMSLDESGLSAAKDYLHGSAVRELVERTSHVMSTIPGSVSGGEAPSSASASTSTTQPLIVNLRGLESMHTAESTSILYIAPEDGTNRLYPLCVALQKLFKDNDLLVKDNRALKLHATVVNTIYDKGRKSSKDRSRGSSGHGPHANAPLKIDATALLEKYQDFVWAEDVALDRIAICEMGAKKVFDAVGVEIGAEYTEVATIALPGRT